MAGLKGSQQAYLTEAYDGYFRPPQKKPASPVASLDALVDTATKAWNGLPPFMVRIWFDAATGAHLRRSTTRPVTWALRWVYFALGLLGWLLISTGFLFWVEVRRKAYETAGLGGARYELEIWAFFAVWLAAFAYAWLRPWRAWIDVCWIATALAVAAVGLNAVTTGDHLGRSIGRGLRAVAVTAFRLQRRKVAYKIANLVRQGQ